MRKFVLYGVIIFQILLIVSLVRGIQLSARSKERIEGMQQTKEKLLAEREKLKQEQEYVQSPFYLEEVARNELHLSKEGETVVIIPDNLIIGEEMGKQEENREERENWQKWWDVVSGSNWAQHIPSRKPMIFFCWKIHLDLDPSVCGIFSFGTCRAILAWEHAKFTLADGGRW